MTVKTVYGWTHDGQQAFSANPKLADAVRKEGISVFSYVPMGHKDEEIRALMLESKRLQRIVDHCSPEAIKRHSDAENLERVIAEIVGYVNCDMHELYRELLCQNGRSADFAWEIMERIRAIAGVQLNEKQAEPIENTAIKGGVQSNSVEIDVVKGIESGRVESAGNPIDPMSKIKWKLGMRWAACNPSGVVFQSACRNGWVATVLACW